MASNRGLRGDVARLRALFLELGRHHSLRDPLSRLREPVSHRLIVEMSPAQFHTLVWLGTDGPLHCGDLAQRLGVSMPACTALLDRACSLGLVRRNRSTRDRRVVVLDLTTRGRRLFRRMDTVMTEHLTRFLQIMDPGDRRALLGIFARFVKAVRGGAARPKHQLVEAKP